MASRATRVVRWFTHSGEFWSALIVILLTLAIWAGPARLNQSLPDRHGTKPLPQGMAVSLVWGNGPKVVLVPPMDGWTTTAEPDHIEMRRDQEKVVITPISGVSDVDTLFARTARAMMAQRGVQIAHPGRYPCPDGVSCLMAPVVGDNKLGGLILMGDRSGALAVLHLGEAARAAEFQPRILDLVNSIKEAA